MNCGTTGPLPIQFHHQEEGGWDYSSPTANLATLTVIRPATASEDEANERVEALVKRLRSKGIRIAGFVNVTHQVR